MKFANIRVYNFENALRGMRNPKNSWDKSDSEFGYVLLEKNKETAPLDTNVYTKIALLNNSEYDLYECHKIGEKDLALAQSLIKAGSEHRKFMRQIFVTVDITAPLFWWKEFDTYKVGTVANSTSTMHKILSKPISLESFEIGDYSPDLQWICENEKEYKVVENIEHFTKRLISELKGLQEKTIEMYSKKVDSSKIAIAKKYWKELIRWLPASWLQLRTVTMDYENLLSMCSKGQRRFHKLNEWSLDNSDSNMESFISFSRSLPYAQELIFLDEISKKTTN